LNDLGEAHAILEASPGQVLRVKVRTSISRKNGKEYTNCFILEVINTTTEATSADSKVLTVDATQEVIEAPAEVPAEAPTE